METKKLSKQEYSDIRMAVVMGHEVHSYVKLAAGIAKLGNISRDEFMKGCGLGWDEIDESIEKNLAIAERRASQP